MNEQLSFSFHFLFSVGLVPVLTHIHICFQIHGELCRRAHFFPENRLYLLNLIGRRLNQQLIVNLQDQPGFPVSVSGIPGSWRS